MQTSQAGVDLIKEFEGCRLKACRCPAGVLTAGYGSTGPHVKPTTVYTLEQAETRLRLDLMRFEQAVIRGANDFSQHQFDAMVSLAFNVGIGAFEKSTLLRKHNAGDHEGAAREFGRWNKAGGRVLAGLTRRRAAEAVLYLK